MPGCTRCASISPNAFLSSPAPAASTSANLHVITSLRPDHAAGPGKQIPPKLPTRSTERSTGASIFSSRTSATPRSAPRSTTKPATSGRRASTEGGVSISASKATCISRGVIYTKQGEVITVVGIAEFVSELRKRTGA